jgi:hypothetical protein
MWPSLLSKLPDTDDATRLRSEFQVEMSRLDAAA